MDERFLMHRLKSTSLAAVTGGVSLGVWTWYEHIVNHTIRRDLWVILGIMAVTKLSAMIYYRFSN